MPCRHGVDRDLDICRSCEDYDAGYRPMPSGIYDLRDYFAAAALAALIGTPNPVTRGDVKVASCAEHAVVAYEFADAMLAERKRK